MSAALRTIWLPHIATGARRRMLRATSRSGLRIRHGRPMDGMTLIAIQRSTRPARRSRVSAGTPPFITVSSISFPTERLAPSCVRMNSSRTRAMSSSIVNYLPKASAQDGETPSRVNM